MKKPVAVIIGFIGKLPFAGMSVYNLHHILGLQDLGYDVHYVERQNTSNDCYDPDAKIMTDDPSYAITHLRRELTRVGMASEDFSFIDRANCCHGSGWASLRSALDAADFVLDLESPTWFDELERCPRRAFVDGDPLFTQTAMMIAGSDTARAVSHYDVLFTYGARMGASDCILPSLNREWIPARPVVATRLWDPTPASDRRPISALMQWKAGSEIQYNGRSYGHKDREFEQFMDLPKRTHDQFVLALGGSAPRNELRDNGWQFADPLASTRTIEAYQEFIAGSRAELGIAKNAYVASRCGWFSDRSICYMAGGRPVLHQDTGFTDWLPAGKGVLAFSNMEELLESLRSLDLDYEQHARAARRIVEEHFEATTVLGQMIQQAGFA